MNKLTQIAVALAFLAANGIATTATAASGISIAHFGHSFYPPDPCRAGCATGRYFPPEPTLRRDYPPEPTLRRYFSPQPTLRRYFPPNPI